MGTPTYRQPCIKTYDIAVPWIKRFLVERPVTFDNFQPKLRGERSHSPSVGINLETRW